MLDSQIDKVQQQSDIIERKQATDFQDLKKKMDAMDAELRDHLQNETEKLRFDVNQITSQAAAHRDTLQEKYNEKLSKIKDVCAKYFSKYEKHLMNQQELMKDLEKRQDKWVNTLIKPQDINQARLFSIDSRIKEGELTRLKDQQFLRDTFKKLIYAIEQMQITQQATQNIKQQATNRSQQQTRSGTR